MIWIDGKNPALYKGGIHQWLESILISFESVKLESITLVSPRLATGDAFPGIQLTRLRLPWFSIFPRRLSHLIYNSFSFYIMACVKKPNVIFSPYYDVNSPRKIPTIYSIHDLCFKEVPELYSKYEVKYFLWAMKRSIKKAHSIVTVSNATKDSICHTFGVDPNRIFVIPNSLNTEFQRFNPSATEVTSFRKMFDDSKSLILYTGGAENRKNLLNLAVALEELISRGMNPQLIFTGHVSPKWKRIFASNPNMRQRVTFLGHVPSSDLKIFYLAADVVVYPSKSEGFGRACLEAMSVGIPLACSNLPSFREVARDYAVFFNPDAPKEIADGIQKAIQVGRVDPLDISQLLDYSDFDRFLKVLFDLNVAGVSK